MSVKTTSNLEFEILFKCLFGKKPEPGFFTKKLQDELYTYTFEVKVEKNASRETLDECLKGVYAYLSKLDYWPLDRCPAATGNRTLCHNTVNHVVVFKSLVVNDTRYRFRCASHVAKYRMDPATIAVFELVDRARLHKMRREVLKQYDRPAR